MPNAKQQTKVLCIVIARDSPRRRLLVLSSSIFNFEMRMDVLMSLYLA